MRRDNEAAAAAAPAPAAAPAAGGPNPSVQSEPFYVADRSLRDGAINPNWTLDSPGTQKYGASVYFPQAFNATPNVVAGITGIEAQADDNGDWRVQMEVVDRKPDHFDVVVTKQGDIEIHLVNAVWVAWVGGQMMRMGLFR